MSIEIHFSSLIAMLFNKISTSTTSYVDISFHMVVVEIWWIWVITDLTQIIGLWSYLYFYTWKMHVYVNLINLCILFVAASWGEKMVFVFLLLLLRILGLKGTLSNAESRESESSQLRYLICGGYGASTEV